MSALATSATPPEVHLDGSRVLVVDDDVRNLFAVTSLLERYGVQVMAASSAEEAFGILDRHPDTDLVLMDIMMPGMDGYQATQRIRQSERLAGVPIVALTAKAMPGDRDKCLEAGCNDFLTKPVEPDQLLSLLDRLVRRAGPR
jgi:CheY-like chemotaxis protein